MDTEPRPITKQQLLQIIPVNIIVIIGIVASAVGLYWKFDARISQLEQNPRFGMTVEEKSALLDRVTRTEASVQRLEPMTVETHTNVLWLMDKQYGNNKTRP